jgi:AraC family transcriptional regulator of adaptative response/methylated-DNA-[protein]-cysteine methyltransferase
MQTMSKAVTTTAPLDPRWASVAAKDETADGRFVYAVTSTGIYCRPSCPSRRPQADRVRFFDDPVSAERAGFRACLRCRPREATQMDPLAEKIRRATVYLSNINGAPSLAALAARFGGSPYHLQRNFKRIVGITPREYADACRETRVRSRLRKGADVTSAMFDAGYNSSSRFYEGAAARLGMPPSTYRAGGAGATIRYALMDSPLGRLLVGATERGVCFVAMADSDAELRRRLAVEYPAAELAHDNAGLGRWTNAILAHLAGRQPRLDLPLDVRATSFRWQVWAALMSIPPGETRTYAQVAQAVGRPRAARAVASACAANPVALVIPCHRVVPASGSGGGYRWGAQRKRALLKSERPG